MSGPPVRARSTLGVPQPGLSRCPGYGFTRDEGERLEQVLANLEQQLLGARVTRQRVEAGEIDQQGAGRQRVASNSRRDPDAAFDMQNLATLRRLRDTP